MEAGVLIGTLGRSVRLYGTNGFGRCGLIIGSGALSPQIAPPRGIFVIGEGTGLSVQDMWDEVGFREWALCSSGWPPRSCCRCRSDALKELDVMAL